MSSHSARLNLMIRLFVHKTTSRLTPDYNPVWLYGYRALRPTDCVITGPKTQAKTNVGTHAAILPLPQTCHYYLFEFLSKCREI